MRQHLILAGGGHSHALVLRMWAMNRRRRPADARLTLVSRRSTALYSGMVPGLVAGLYRREACSIDLRRLCLLAGAAFVQAEIAGLNHAARELVLQGRPPLRYDLLSLDVGAVTAVPGDREEAGLPVKPLEPFLAWCEGLGSTPEPGAPGSKERPLTIRGGGAAAVEVALALVGRRLACRLLLRGDELHLGSRTANRRGEALLAATGVDLVQQAPQNAPADLLCTGSRAPAWLAAAGLPVDPGDGRVRTEASLAVIGHPNLFASGDCGVIAAAPRPAAGVWAVRAAPVLADNLVRRLSQPERPLRPWRPQGRALQLLGDSQPPPQGPRALALRGPLALGPSRWLWRWKEAIDRRFIARFHALEAMASAPMGPGGTEARGAAMACRGCAAKLAADPLRRALGRLDPSQPAPEAEDAAVITTTAAGERLLQSVDGFPALLEDPWLNARLTTLHACSDLWACGADVESVQALVTIPEGAPPLQEELLLQTLAGVRSVLDPLGAALIGGHTLEGRDGAGLSLALTVVGRSPAGRFWPKGPLRPGDALVLTRALGSGVLFAAAMAGQARPEWIDAALAAMEGSQAPLVALLAAHGCRACTDVTGFGLLGHLGEMLAGSPANTRVRLATAAVPVMAGSLELLEQGLASTLAPANAGALTLLDGPVHLQESGDDQAARRALLIDPQTCGPLLAALPAERIAEALAALHRAGFADARQIGQVTAEGWTTRSR
ncbi:selenide, water dikinase SelD [Cyanobium sp. FGCU-6]|jgi:selenide,water dikinase|nr:selenide, water dikinase SelD [Cyanobium sp. FGCU6]